MPTASMEMDEDGKQEAVPLKGINVTDSSIERKSKKEKTLIEGGKRKKGITLNVSHMNLTESMKTGGSMGMAERIRIVRPNGDTEKKERVLFDITNKLEARPTTFKPG